MIKEIQKLCGVTADGIIGINTISAICKKLKIKETSNNKDTIKQIQIFCGVTADGIIGNKTTEAILNNIRNMDNSKETDLEFFYITKPIKITNVNYKQKMLTQSEIRTGKSPFGKCCNEDSLVSVKVPENYPLKYDGKIVKSIRIHKLVSDRLEAVLNDVILHYGKDIEIVAPAICVYDGSYYCRNSRGGSSQSIHSWGLAIDFDAANNGMNTKFTNGRLSKPIYKPFWDICKSHGLLSLGQRQNSDGMHAQFTLWG